MTTHSFDAPLHLPLKNLVKQLQNEYNTYTKLLNQHFQEIMGKLSSAVKTEREFAEKEKKLNLQAAQLEVEKNTFLRDKKRAEDNFHISDEIITLNVGGTEFITLLNTLTSVEDSMLSSMFSGRFPLTKDSKNRCFIDRDPFLFRYILNGLRSKCWIFPNDEEEKKNFFQELEYFCLLPLGLEGKIYVVGGCDGQNDLAIVETFDICQQEWSLGTPMPTERSAMGIVCINSSLYVMAGRDNNDNILNTVEKYDINHDTWTSLAPMLSTRWHIAAEACEGKIYVVGGGNIQHNVFHEVECYDPSTNIWCNVAPISIARFRPGAANFNGKLYVMGGMNENSHVLNSMEIYDPRLNSWSLAPELQTPRYALSACGVRNKIYAIGGRSEHMVLKTVEVFDPILNEWSYGVNLPQARTGHSTCVDRQKIYVIGGWDGNKYCNNVFCFDIETGIWGTCHPLPTARSTLKSAVAYDTNY